MTRNHPLTSSHFFHLIFFLECNSDGSPFCFLLFFFRGKLFPGCFCSLLLFDAFAISRSFTPLGDSGAGLGVCRGGSHQEEEKKKKSARAGQLFGLAGGWWAPHVTAAGSRQTLSGRAAVTWLELRASEENVAVTAVGPRRGLKELSLSPEREPLAQLDGASPPSPAATWARLFAPNVFFSARGQ